MNLQSPYNNNLVISYQGNSILIYIYIYIFATLHDMHTKISAELNLRSLHRKHGILTTGPPGKSLILITV